MIASVRYDVTGAEVKSSGTTLVKMHAAGGYEILDVLLNGESLNHAVDVVVDETRGDLTFNSTLNRGDYVLTIYKTIPWAASAAINDFETSDFETADFT